MTPLDKKKLGKLHKAGLSYRKIGKELGVSHSTVRYHVKRFSYPNDYPLKPGLQTQPGLLAPDLDSPQNPNDIYISNQLLKELPPAAGEWTLPAVQQYVGIIQTVSKFYKNPDEAIRASPTNARTMFNNLTIREPLQARMLAVAELPWHVEATDKTNPAHKKIASDIQRIIEEIPDFLKFRFSLLYAIWFGKWAIQQKYTWDFSTGRKRLIVKDWTPVHGDTLTPKWNTNQWGIYTGLFSGWDGTKEVTTEPGFLSRAHVLSDYREDKTLSLQERQAFVIHSHDYMPGEFLDPQSAGGVKGLGIRSVVYWTWYVMNEISGWLVEFLERVGTGITIFRYLRGNAESLNAVKQIAESQSFQGVILWPVDPEKGKNLEDVERIEPSPVGIDNMMRVLDEYYGGQIRRYIVGQDATSRPVAAGLNSSTSQTHENTFNRLITYDAMNLADTLTKDLVRVIEEWSYPGEEAKCKFVFDIDKPDSKAQLDAIKVAFDMGVTFDEDEVRALTGCAKPDIDAKILGGKEQQPAGMPGQGFPPGASPAAPEDGEEPGFNDEEAENDNAELDSELEGTEGPERKVPFRYGWDEAAHPRGNKDNPGQFAPAGSGGASDQGGFHNVGKRPATSYPKAPPATPAEKPSSPQDSGKEEGEAQRKAESRKRLTPIADALKANPKLSHEQRVTYLQASKKVLDRMTPEAHERFVKGCHAPPSFHADLAGVRNELIEQSSNNPKNQEAIKAAGVIAGAYAPSKEGKRYLVLDGGVKFGGKNEVNTIEGVYAHEMMHAIDGPAKEISKSKEWGEAFQEELGNARLNAYASTSPQEGLAEFGRLILAGEHNLAVVKKAFPKCYAVLESHKLIPQETTKHAKEEAISLPDLFDKPLALDNGTMGDTLKDSPKVFAWDDKAHPRGNKDNPGQFAPKGSGGAGAKKTLPKKNRPKGKGKPSKAPAEKAPSSPQDSKQPNKTAQPPTSEKGKPTAGKDASFKPEDAVKLDTEQPGTIARLKERAKEIGAKLGKPIWDRISPKWQGRLAATYEIGKKVEHHLESYYKGGQELAKQVAKDRGLSDEHVEKVGRVLGVADAIARWTVNIPAVHHGLHLAGVGGLAGFAGAKVGYYVPVASLGYIAHSMAAETIKGKNPFKTIRDARAKVKARMQAEHEHKAETHEQTKH